MNFTTESTEIAEKTVRFNDADLNKLSGEVIDCAIYVHKRLGPGLLESAYQHCMAHLFLKRNIPFQREKLVSIPFDDTFVDAAYRADFIVSEKIIIEVKSVDRLVPIHDAQLLTYMKLGGFSLGLLLNFNEQLMKSGIRRMRL